MADNRPFIASAGNVPPDLLRVITDAVATTLAAVADVEAGRCPECKQSMHLEQQGTAVVAMPCNHFLYHGDLPPRPCSYCVYRK